MARNKDDWEEKTEQGWGKLHLWFLHLLIEQIAASGEEEIGHDCDNEDENSENEYDSWCPMTMMMRRDRDEEGFVSGY